MYQRWIDELWNGDLDELPAIAERLVAPGFIGHWPHRPGRVHGPHELAAVIHEGRSMFSGLTFDVVFDVDGDGPLIAGRWVGRGTYEGEQVDFHGHDMLRHNGSQFVEYWVIAEDPAVSS